MEEATILQVRKERIVQMIQIILFECIGSSFDHQPDS